MPSNSVAKLGVRYPSAIVAVLDIKVTGAAGSDTSWKKMSDDSAVTFPLNVTAAAQPYIYTNNPGSYDISFKVNGVEVAEKGNAVLRRHFNLGEGFIASFAPSSLSPLTLPTTAADGTYGQSPEGDAINVLVKGAAAMGQGLV